ncbi:MAG: hypothetical protein JWO91_3345, partial [Acidobacteriaceae bacterium]|nr:hypothetical protein [Acidobacteriaceae bacterium]
ALGWIERAVGDDCDARSTVQSIKNPILPNLGGVGRNRIREPIMTLPTLWIFPVRRPFCENIRQHVLRGVNSPVGKTISYDPIGVLRHFPAKRSDAASTGEKFRTDQGHSRIYISPRRSIH